MTVSRRKSRATVPLVVTGMMVVSLALGFATGASAQEIAERQFAVHDTGLQWLGMRNDGSIGSQGAPDSVWAPALEYPGGAGTFFLGYGGLWVGAKKGCQEIVSVGSYLGENEYGQLELATPSDLNNLDFGSIGWLEKRSTDMTPDAQYQARRAGRYLGYGHWGIDDDSDGRIDEDPAGDISRDFLDNDLDGLTDEEDPDLDGDGLPGDADDDGDGLQDEDDLTIADQELIAVYVDTCETCVENPVSDEFSPLGVRIIQHSYQWSESFANDLILFRYSVTNMVEDTLRDVCAGMFFDFDIGHESEDVDERGYDDYTYFVDHLRLAVGADDDGNDGLLTGRFFGVCVVEPLQEGIPTTYQNYTPVIGPWPWDETLKYEVLSCGMRAPDQHIPSDWAFLIAIGPLGDLLPDSTMHVTFALVNGPDDDALQYAAQLAGKLIDPEFPGPLPPESPQFGIETGNRQVRLLWRDNAESSIEPVLDQQDFQGYNVWRTPDGESWTLLATYDLQDTIGMNVGWPPEPSDNEDYAYELTDEDVMNGSRFSYVVTAFDDGNNGDGIHTPTWDDRYGGIGVLESSRGEDVVQIVIPAEAAQAEGDIDNVYVVPNPYIGSSRLEQHGWSGGDGRIEFRGLPPECEIEVWTLAGDLVRELKHESGLSWESWDVKNDEGDEVAGGIYIYRVSSGGNERIAKFMVVK
jgi:hypothetical protein